jgi:hypothetical protein
VCAFTHKTRDSRVIWRDQKFWRFISTVNWNAGKTDRHYFTCTLWTEKYQKWRERSFINWLNNNNYELRIRSHTMRCENSSLSDMALRVKSRWNKVWIHASINKYEKSKEQRSRNENKKGRTGHRPIHTHFSCVIVIKLSRSMSSSCYASLNTELISE